MLRLVHLPILYFFLSSRSKLSSSRNSVYNFNLVGKYAAGPASATLSFQLTIKCAINNINPDTQDEISAGSGIMAHQYFTIG